MYMENKKNILGTFIIVGVIILLSVSLAYFIIKSQIPSCPSGYKAVGDKCSKVVEVDAIEIKYCDNDFELNGDSCQKYESINATKNYFCYDFSHAYENSLEVHKAELKGTDCITLYTHEPVEQKNCPDGCGFKNDDECICTFYLPATVMGVGEHQRLVCIQDAVLDGTMCKLTTYPKVTKKTVCIEDFSLVNNRCEWYKTEPAHYNLSCPNGYYLNGNICERTIIVDASIRYECPLSFELSYNKCIKEEMVNKE